MTTGEMIVELRAALGNRTDITDERYTDWLNWAQYDLCGFHRKRLFPSLRFRALEMKTILRVPIVSGQAAGGGDFHIELGPGVVEEDDYFQDCVIKITGYDGDPPDGLLNQVRVICGYDGAGSVAIVDEQWGTNPDGDTEYEIYRRDFDIEEFLEIDPRTTLWAVERLETYRGRKIEKTDWEELLNVDTITALSDTPERFARRGNTLLFDKWVTSLQILRVWYYRYPPLLVAAEPDEESVLPEAWHEVIVLGAIWRGHERLMEPDRAEEAFAIYTNEATNRLNQYMVEEEHIPRNVRARSYYAHL